MERSSIKNRWKTSLLFRFFRKLLSKNIKWQ